MKAVKYTHVKSLLHDKRKIPQMLTHVKSLLHDSREISKYTYTSTSVLYSDHQGNGLEEMRMHHD